MLSSQSSPIRGIGDVWPRLSRFRLDYRIASSTFPRRPTTQLPVMTPDPLHVRYGNAYLQVVIREDIQGLRGTNLVLMRLRRSYRISTLPSRDLYHM